MPELIDHPFGRNISSIAPKSAPRSINVIYGLSSARDVRGRGVAWIGDGGRAEPGSHAACGEHRDGETRARRWIRTISQGRAPIVAHRGGKTAVRRGSPGIERLSTA